VSVVLQVQGVHKRFGGHQAVADLSFDVHEGEIFGLLGPNGAGKTTLLRMILDIYRPDEGTIALFGRAFDRDALAALGYLPEERGVYRRATTLEFLRYLAELRGVPRVECNVEADRWLSRLSALPLRDRKLETLSKGNQQKVQLLSTLVGSPRLLVWDEPFSGLDPVNVDQLRGLLLELHREGRTILLSTHLMPMAESICQRVGLVHQGRMVLLGGVDEILDREAPTAVEVLAEGEIPAHPAVQQVEVLRADAVVRAKLHLRPPVDSATLLSDLVTAGARLRSFRPLRPSMEEVFLRTVGARSP
jgi:ABC-2 type transport system ATP-binding protein